MFALWEYLLLKKYHWFNDTRIFIPVSEAANPPDDIRLIFIVQIVIVLKWIDYRLYGFSKLSAMYLSTNVRKTTMSCLLIILWLCVCAVFYLIHFLYLVVAYTSHYRSGLLILFVFFYFIYLILSYMISVIFWLILSRFSIFVILLEKKTISFLKLNMSVL